MARFIRDTKALIEFAESNAECGDVVPEGAYELLEGTEAHLAAAAMQFGQTTDPLKRKLIWALVRLSGLEDKFIYHNEMYGACSQP